MQMIENFYQVIRPGHGVQTCRGAQNQLYKVHPGAF